MSDSVAVEIRETDSGRYVAVVRIDRPPVNAIGGAMKERLLCVAAERFALGGGCELALSPDFRISHRTSGAAVIAAVGDDPPTIDPARARCEVGSDGEP